MKRRPNWFIAAALAAIPTVPMAAENHPPVAVPPGALALSGASGTSATLDANAIFVDPDIIRPGATQVNFVTELGTLSLEMLDLDAPRTVQNFLRYVQAGRYEQVFWHRSVPNFVVQTGGYLYDGNATSAVPAFPPVANEFRVSNVRGTVAMAKLGGDPNSATSQWFINLADNSANLDAQNGGFTVFARMIEGSMSVADAIAALPVYNLGGLFDSVPLRGYPGSGAVTPSNLVHLAGITAGPNLSFSATSDDPSVAQASVVGAAFRVYLVGSGAANVTLRATDLGGLSAQASVRVNVTAPGALAGISHTPALTRLTFRGQPNAHYAIDHAASLDGAWSALAADVVAGSDGVFGFDDTPSGAKRFYRARSLP